MISLSSVLTSQLFYVSLTNFPSAITIDPKGKYVNKNKKFLIYLDIKITRTRRQACTSHPPRHVVADVPAFR
jgi:hypothetical protein